MNLKTLQYLMGHSDVSVTLNIYTHTGYDDAKKELARLKEAKKELDKNRLCAQLRVCSQAGGIPVYPRFSQPDNSESWDDAGNGI